MIVAHPLVSLQQSIQRCLTLTEVGVCRHVVGQYGHRGKQTIVDNQVYKIPIDLNRTNPVKVKKEGGHFECIFFCQAFKGRPPSVNNFVKLLMMLFSEQGRQRGVGSDFSSLHNLYILLFDIMQGRSCGGKGMVRLSDDQLLMSLWCPIDVPSQFSTVLIPSLQPRLYFQGYNCPQSVGDTMSNEYLGSRGTKDLLTYYSMQIADVFSD